MANKPSKGKTELLKFIKENDRIPVYAEAFDIYTDHVLKEQSECWMTVNGLKSFDKHRKKQTFNYLNKAQLFDQINHLEDICTQQQHVIKETSTLVYKTVNDIKFKNDLINKLIVKNTELKNNPPAPNKADT